MSPPTNAGMRNMGLVATVGAAVLFAGCKEAELKTSGEGVTQKPENSATAGESGEGEDSGSTEVVPKNPAKSGRKPPPVVQFAYGLPIEGKEGFVLNPWTNRPVDVRGIPPGTLVVDPMDQERSHKFRVPKTGEDDNPATANIPVLQPNGEYPEANPHPEKEGWVLNPFTGETVEVGNLPPGSFVTDPNDPDPAHVFRVPRPPEGG